MPVVQGIYVTTSGLQADLPSTAAEIASALGIPQSEVLAGMSFFCSDTNAFYMWNGAAMVQIGAEGFISPMLAAGDLIYEDPSLGAARLPVGTSGEVLTVVNGLPAWAATAQSTTFEASGSVLSSDSTVNFEGDGTYISVSNPSAGNVKSVLSIAAVQSALASAFDAYGSAATAQSNAESFATSAVATETSRAESAEALLAPLASPTFTGTATIPTAAVTTLSGNPNFSGIPTFASGAGLGSGTFSGAATFSGALTFSANLIYTGNSTTTVGTATASGTETLQNTAPTVTGASTTLALTQATLSSGNTIYTFASTSGAASNAWVNASVTIAGFTNAGNNGTFVITASTATTFTVVNASGVNETHAATAISSAVVQSPAIVLAGTYGTGTNGASAADSWTIQTGTGWAGGDNAAPTGPNPKSLLRLTHSGSTAQAYVEVPAITGPSGGGLILDANGNGGGVSFTMQRGLYAQGSINWGPGGGAVAFGLATASANSGAPICLQGYTVNTANATCIELTNQNLTIAPTTGTTVGVDIGNGAAAGGLYSMTFHPTSGSASFVGLQITPVINASGSSGSFTALKVNPTMTAAPTGTSLLLDLQVGGTSKFNVNTAGALQMSAASAAPTSAGTAGTAGQIIYYSGNMYFCSVTGAAGSATWNKLNMTAV